MTAHRSVLKILVAHGVNLDLLGTRQTDIYGKLTLKDINQQLQHHAILLKKQHNLHDIQLTFYQTNVEGDLLQKLGEQPWDGVLINPAAWTHTSLALADRLVGLQLTYVEVHLSNIAARENFRHHSYSAKNAAGVVYGFGHYSYLAGLTGLVGRLV